LSKLFLSSATPYFDRLLGLWDGLQVDKTLDAAGLRASLARDIAQLFSTKSRLTIKEFMELEISVLDYGLPDFSALSPNSQSDMDLMSETIAKAFECFEPRLREVVLTLTTESRDSCSVNVAIVAAVTLNGRACRVNFDLAYAASGILTLQPE